MTHTFRRRAAALLAGAAVAAAGCTNDFLTGTTETRQDPNRPITATAPQRFVGVQSNIAAFYGSDPLRLASLFVQQLDATGGAYIATAENYSLSESTTNGFFTSVYAGGGLIDLRNLQTQVRAVNDSLFLGIAQVQEALLMGGAADVFGNIPYTQAYTSETPPLDSQLVVYDSLQSLLTQAIANIRASGPTNVGPRGADRVFGGNRARWTAAARTLKARLLLHTAKVRPNVYVQALAEASQGIADTAGNYAVPFSGNVNEENFSFQFNVVQRAGQIAPGTFFVGLLRQRNDPRRAQYFTNDSTLGTPFTTATLPVTILSANENLLIVAESAYRTGDQARALAALQQAQALDGVPPSAATLSGPALLREILTEKYVALFPNLEVWNDYKRTCFPNLTPLAGSGRNIPARLFYDANERQTNPANILPPERQPARNPVDPPLDTDPFGNPCLGQ